MSEVSRSRGTAMMAIGLLMVISAVLVAAVIEEPLPVAFGAIGLVFVAVGSRWRRQAR